MINLTSHNWIVRTENGGNISVPMSVEIHSPLVLRRKTVPTVNLRPGIKVVVKEVDREDIDEVAQVIEKLSIRRKPILVSGHVFEHIVPYLSRLALMYLFAPDTSPKSVIRKDGKIIGVKRLRAVPLWRRAEWQKKVEART